MEPNGPHNDGRTHINVYSKGQTALGRFLSNFAKAPIETVDGSFDSIEGYWYWLSCRDDRLRTLSGTAAKKLGRDLRADDWRSDEEFQGKICDAIQLKLERYPEYLEELRASDLPLDHYYVYFDTLKRPSSGKWVLHTLERLRQGGPARLPDLFDELKAD